MLPSRSALTPSALRELMSPLEMKDAVHGISVLVILLERSLG